MSSKKDKEKNAPPPPTSTPAPITEIQLPKSFRGLLKHLMYSLHVVRPVGAASVDKFCYEWFANRIAEQRSEKPGAFNEDLLDDNIWKLEVAEPPLLSYGDDEDSDFDDDEIDVENVFDLKELDPMRIVEDEAARKIQLSYRAFIQRRKLRTRRVDADRAKQRAKKQQERPKKGDKKSGNKTDLHWTATESLIPGLENDMDLNSIAAENDQRTSEDRAERHRASEKEKMQRNYNTRTMLDKVGADQEEADLAAAKIQAVYRKHQIDKTRTEIAELQKTTSAEAVADDSEVGSVTKFKDKKAEETDKKSKPDAEKKEKSAPKKSKKKNR